MANYIITTTIVNGKTFFIGKNGEEIYHNSNMRCYFEDEGGLKRSITRSKNTYTETTVSVSKERKAMGKKNLSFSDSRAFKRGYTEKDCQAVFSLYCNYRSKGNTPEQSYEKVAQLRGVSVADVKAMYPSGRAIFYANKSAKKSAEKSVEAPVEKTVVEAPVEKTVVEAPVEKTVVEAPVEKAAEVPTQAVERVTNTLSRAIEEVEQIRFNRNWASVADERAQNFGFKDYHELQEMCDSSEGSERALLRRLMNNAIRAANAA